MTPPTTVAPGTERAAARPRRPLGPLVLGAVLLAVGAFLFWYAYDAAGGDFAAAGPWLAPVVVSGGWLLLALWYLIQQIVSPAQAAQADQADDSATPRADDSSDESEQAQVQWLPPVLIVAALCGYVLVLESVGFVLASAVLFIAVARILGSRQLIRDAAIGVPLALVVYLAFTYLLAIQLPSGVLPI